MSASTTGGRCPRPTVTRGRRDVAGRSDSPPEPAAAPAAEPAAKPVSGWNLLVADGTSVAERERGDGDDVVLIGVWAMWPSVMVVPLSL